MFRKTSVMLLSLLFASYSMAELVVVVHPSNGDALSAKQVQRIFLGKEKKFPSGSETVAINQSVDSNQRQSFDQDILGRSSSQVSAYWSKLVFTGKGVPPKEVNSDAEVIELVSQNPSVIGYIDKASVTDAVKVVEL
jgi:ABC-type phosphate transport system substrate-binding protein